MTKSSKKEMLILLRWITEIKNRKIKKEFEKELLLENIIKNKLGKLDCKLKGSIYKKIGRNDKMNKIFLDGNLTKQPELRYTKTGTPVCTFDIVVDEGYKDQKTGERVENDNFFTIVTWRGQAESCAKHLEVGSLVNILGKLVIRESKANNTTYQNPEIHAESVEFMDWKVNKKLMRKRLENNNQQNNSQNQQSA